MGVGLVVLAAQGGIPTHDSEVFSYAIARVVLLIVGCALSIFATANRTARPPRRNASPREADGPTTSASVARLLHDVRGWTKHS